jgi:hypothetical protein
MVNKEKKDKKNKGKVSKGKFGRRTWDTEQYQNKVVKKNINFEKFKEDLKKNKEKIIPNKERKPLEARKEEIGILIFINFYRYKITYREKKGFSKYIRCIKL